MKKLLAFLLIAAMAAGVCACGGTLSADEYCDKGEEYLSLKNYEKAAECFNKAISLAASERAFKGLGDACLGLENYSAAGDAYLSAAALSADAALYAKAGDAYKKTGLEDKAQQAFALSTGLSGGQSGEASGSAAGDAVKQWLADNPGLGFICADGDSICYRAGDGRLMLRDCASGGETTLFEGEVITGSDAYDGTVYFCVNGFDESTNRYKNNVLYSAKLDGSPAKELCTLPLSGCGIAVDGSNLLIFGLDPDEDASHFMTYYSDEVSFDGSSVGVPYNTYFEPFPQNYGIAGRYYASANGRGFAVKNGSLYRICPGELKECIGQGAGDEIAAVDGGTVYLTNSTGTQDCAVTITAVTSVDTASGVCIPFNIPSTNADGRLIEIYAAYDGELYARYTDAPEDASPENPGYSFYRCAADGTLTKLG